MAIVTNNGKIISKKRVLTTDPVALFDGQDCCCECNVSATFVFGETSSVRIYSLVFPSAAACVRLVFSGSFSGLVVVETSPPVAIIHNQAVSAGSTVCLSKPAGATSVTISLPGAPSFMTGSLAVTCNTCNCNPLP